MHNIPERSFQGKHPSGLNLPGFTARLEDINAPDLAAMCTPPPPPHPAPTHRQALTSSCQLFQLGFPST